MKNTKFYLIAMLMVALFASSNVQAQSNTEEVDMMQSIYGMEKKAVVTQFLNIESDNAFWALYDAYELDRKALGKKRLQILEDYAEGYEKMDDLKYDEIIKNMISSRKATDKLIDSYYKKIKKASGSKIAGQFFQLEEYFLSVIRLEIMEGIPYIGEFEKE